MSRFFGSGGEYGFGMSLWSQSKASHRWRKSARLIVSYLHGIAAKPASSQRPLCLIRVYPDGALQ